MKSALLAFGMIATIISSGATADIDLAKRSGCLACHSVSKKIIGPSLRDIGKRYKDDAGAKARLIAKVKSGSRGAWGSAPMPPYSPRVSDENIEILVTFVLSLGE